MTSPCPTDPVSLFALRRSRSITQTRLAATLGVTQSEVSRIERHPNLLVATVRAYASAIGAELEVAMRFGDGERVVLDLGATDPSDPEPPPA